MVFVVRLHNDFILSSYYIGSGTDPELFFLFLVWSHYNSRWERTEEKETDSMISRMNDRCFYLLHFGDQ